MVEHEARCKGWQTEAVMGTTRPVSKPQEGGRKERTYDRPPNAYTAFFATKCTRDSKRRPCVAVAPAKSFFLCACSGMQCQGGDGPRDGC